MSDLAHRRAERSDPAAALAWRLREGGISHERVAYAAALGNTVALEVCEPIELPAASPSWEFSRARHGARLLGPVGAGQWAYGLAKRAAAWESSWTGADPAGPVVDADRAMEAATRAMWADEPVWAEEKHVWAAEAALSAVESGAITWDEVLASLAERLLA